MIIRETQGSSGSRIGLVLGAGGATGAAFHAGTLLALQHDLGWNPNSADVIVGSSAGSIVGALLRAGFSADDLAAWGASVDARPAGLAGRAVLDDIRATRHRVTPSIPRLRLPSRRMWSTLLHPSRPRLHAAILASLPYGWIDAATTLERFGSLLDEWPQRELWVTAVRASDARRVVFGHDDIAVTPGQAIAASCAIPAMFTPVMINGQRYIDGGSHSPTNADLLLDADIDTAIVLSPMSVQHHDAGRGPSDLLRTIFRRRLKAECDVLIRAGVDVHIFEPDAATSQTMGINALDNDRAPHVQRDAFLAAGARIAGSRSIRDRLTPTTRADVSGDPRVG